MPGHDEGLPPLGVDLARLIETLERHKVEYLIVGGVAAVGYGLDRLTDDADCVVSRDLANLAGSPEP